MVGNDSNNGDNDNCAIRCETQRKAASEHFGVDDVMNVSQLKEAVLNARYQMTETLRQHYGDYVDKLFFLKGYNASSRGYEAFKSPGKSKTSPKRLQRKLMIKILEMQTNVLERSVPRCTCPYTPTEGLDPDALSGGRRNLRPTPPSTSSSSSSSSESNRNLQGFPDHLYSKFVWSTGGHSAAAGHGNFCHESYTGYMARTAGPVFARIGIDLEGRNYAMGGMPSAPMLAVCNVAIYGADADVISWDYGMTDGRDYWRKGMYTRRAGMHPNRPVVVDINVDGSVQTKSWLGVSSRAESMGVAAFYLDTKHIREMHDLIPDMMGMPMADVEQLPPYLQHYKCDNKIEFGDPDCREYKYTKGECPRRKGQVSWHPGYKSHSLYGTLMAYFLVDNLVNALVWLEEEVKSHPMHPRARWEHYSQNERQDYSDYQSTMVSKQETAGFKGDMPMAKFIDAMFRNNVYCHTAVTPSQDRYLGLSINGVDEHTPYPAGTDLQSASHMTTNRNGKMVLVYSPDEIEKCDRCYRIDFKNYFYTNSHMGPSRLTVPTGAELDEYGPTMVSPVFEKAVIMVCTVLCDWGKCPPGEVSHENYGEGLHLTVNGRPVKKMLSVQSFCSILIGENDDHEWVPNENHQFDIEAVTTPTQDGAVSYMRITAVAVMDANPPKHSR